MNKKLVLALTVMVAMAFAACAQHDPESDFAAEPVDGGRSVAIVGYLNYE